jgi:hypothetical protein
MRIVSSDMEQFLGRESSRSLVSRFPSHAFRLSVLLLPQDIDPIVAASGAGGFELPILIELILNRYVSSLNVSSTKLL